MNGMNQDSHSSMGKPILKQFMFEPGYRNLNHASYGAHPKAVHEAFIGFQNASIRSPDRFIRYELAEHLLQARRYVAELLRVDANECVMVANATTGVNTVLRNLQFAKGDTVIYFSTIYGANEQTLFSLAETTSVELVKLPLVYGQDPRLCSDRSIVQLFDNSIAHLRAAGKNPRLALFDTITSMPGVRMPFEALTASCKAHNVLSLVDGAHGIGHFPLRPSMFGPDFLVSNCHKWLFVPRTCAVLYVPGRNQGLIRTTYPTSHGFVALPSAMAGKKASNPLPPPPPGMTPFQVLFEKTPTQDSSSYLCVPAAVRFRQEVCGGEDAIFAYCRSLAQEGGNRAAETLGTDVMDNEDGTLRKDSLMANVRLPLVPSEVKTKEGTGMQAGQEQTLTHWLEPKLLNEHKTFLQTYWHAGSWWCRLSAQIYLEVEDFEWGANVLKELCKEAKTSGIS